MRRPAISDTSGARLKVIFMVASFFREGHASIYWYLTPCERPVFVRLRVCTRNTIEQASRVFCDILARNIEIVRKACVVPSDKVCMDRFASVAWPSSGSHMSVQTRSRTSGLGCLENFSRRSRWQRFEMDPIEPKCSMREVSRFTV